jgi:isoaspartyl peptidase/L-asparaginase-like protein (Ntn-hydrolase superfamily)
MPEPVIISNWHYGKSAVTEGLSKLKETGSALDAVEYGIRAVEDDPLADSVGTGGIPNIEGVAELDASFMVGNYYRCGAVTGLAMTKNPISVARKVMELCPHVMLSGDGARRFARAVGYAEYQPVTDRARAKWKELHSILFAGLKDKSKLDEYHRLVGYDSELLALSKGIELMAEQGQIKQVGTVGALCLDPSGTIVAGTSTSGWALRLPGRVADSSVIGAGTYASPSGACSSTGLGEIAIRHGLTRTVCDFIEQGYTPTEACEAALKKMLRSDREIRVIMALIALDKHGRVGGATTKKSYSFQYQRLSDQEMTVVVPTPVSI